MRPLTVPLALILAALLGSAAARAQSTENDAELFPESEQLLRFGTASRNLTLSPFVQYDFGPTSASNDALGDGYGDTLRLARLYAFVTYDDLGGTFAANVEDETFPVAYAFANWDATDALTLQAGQQDQPFSLQDMSGSRFLPFAEAGESAALIPGDNVGLALYRYGPDTSLSLGVFGGDVNTSVADEGVAVTGRATFTPVYEEERILRGGDATKSGRGTARVEELVHLGLGLSARWNARQPFSFSSSGSSALVSEAPASTASFTDADIYRFNLEAARAWGSLSVQGEFTGVQIEARTVGGGSGPGSMGSRPVSGFAHAGYAYVTWFATGERRSYSRDAATFGRVVPERAIDDGGFGAIELGARIDYLDLSDLGPDAGAQVGASLVVNDYLTKRLRLTADYSYTHVYDGPLDDTNIHALTLRLQFAY